MPKYIIHTLETAPEASKPLLEGALKNYGFVPNLLGVMAEAAPTLEAYLALGSGFEKTSFSHTEKEVITLSVSYINECHYCLAAHSTIATMKKVPADVIEEARAGATLSDPKLDALARLTRNVVKTRGWPIEELMSDFYAQGYTPANYLELLVGVTLKTLSNYVNHQADTPIDVAFGGQEEAA